MTARLAAPLTLFAHVLVTCTTLLVFGCSGQHSTRTGFVPEENRSAPVSYIDEIGRPVELPKHPHRIVSLAPSVTEILYQLGADERLTGVTNHCTWPDDARKKPKIGDLLNPNYEVILAQKPDLIIATTAGNDRAAVLKLIDLKLPVYVTAPRSVEAIFSTVAHISQITDRAPQGERLIADMKNRLAAVKRRLKDLPPTRAFFMTWFDPLLAPGKNTFETDVLRQAHVMSITSEIEEFYPRYSLEQIIASDPDVILTVEHNARSVADLRRVPGWRRLTAVRNGRVYVLSEVIQHPSPRFVDGVEELARKLHPEQFDK